MSFVIKQKLQALKILSNRDKMSSPLRITKRFFRLLPFISYCIWLVLLLGLTWGSLPFLTLDNWFVPPEWLKSFVRSIFYRDYIF